MCTTVEKKNTEAYEGVYTQGCIIKNMHVTRTEGFCICMHSYLLLLFWFIIIQTV